MLKGRDLHPLAHRTSGRRSGAARVGLALQPYGGRGFGRRRLPRAGRAFPARPASPPAPGTRTAPAASGNSRRRPPPPSPPLASSRPTAASPRLPPDAAQTSAATAAAGRQTTEHAHSSAQLPLPVERRNVSLFPPTPVPHASLRRTGRRVEREDEGKSGLCEADSMVSVRVIFPRLGERWWLSVKMRRNTCTFIVCVIHKVSSSSPCGALCGPHFISYEPWECCF